MSAGRPLLAFRPVAAMHRLPARSQACPISLREVLRALGPGHPLPLFRAPLPALARAGLLAAHQARSAVGLALAPGQRPEPWFDAVARAADEIAPRLPIFLSGEVEVAAGEVEQAAGRAQRLVEAGLTHLSVDVSRVPAADRARAAAEVSAFAAEREVAVECRFPDPGREPGPEEAAAFVEELRSWGLAPDLLGVRCDAPGGAAEAVAQARRLSALASGLAGTALARHGPSAPLLLRAFRAAGLAVVEDGALEGPPGGEAGRGGPAAGGDPARLEGLAFAAAAAALDELGCPGTAAAVESGLG